MSLGIKRKMLEVTLHYPAFCPSLDNRLNDKNTGELNIRDNITHWIFFTKKR